MRWTALVFVVLALLPARARAYVRTMTLADGGGACLYWGPRSVHYVINSGGVSTMPFDALTSAIEGGFGAWTGHDCSDFDYVDDGPTDSGMVGFNRVLVSFPGLDGDVPNEHLVVFRPQACADVVPTGDDCTDPMNDDCDNKYNCWSGDDSPTGDVIAFTLVTSELSTGRILDADTSFDAVDFVFEDLARGTCDASVPPSACTDVQNTMAHEAGHFLGLGHSLDPNATMYASVESEYETSKRDLDQDDIDGLCAIYPTGQLPVVCFQHAEADIVGNGCNCGEAELAPAALVMLALLARRRRS